MTPNFSAAALDLTDTGAVTPSQDLALRPAALLVGLVGAIDAVLLLGFGGADPFTAGWSSIGVALALLALSPLRRWPLLGLALFVVTAGVRLLHGLEAGASVALAGAYLAQAVLGALVVTRGARRVGRLESPGDLLALLGAAVTCGAVSMLELLARPGAEGSLGQRLVEVFVQHGVSALLFGALVLTASQLVRPAHGREIELVAQLVLTTAATAFVFAPTQDVPLVFAPLPFLVWAALRFETGVVAAQLVVFSVGVTLATSIGWGPIATSGLEERDAGTVVLVFVVTVALITLPLALTARQRSGLLARLTADEHLFRRNFTESPLGMVLLHAEGDTLVVDDLNPSAYQILGAEGRVLAGRRFTELIDADEATARSLSALLDGRVDAWHGRAGATARPGSRLEVAVASLGSRDGSRVYSTQLLDVTQEHDARRRLQAAHKLTNATLDTTACVILVTDSTGTVVRVNAATKELTGFTDGDLLGHRLWETELSALTRAETEAMFVWPNRSGYPIVKERLGRTAQGDPLRIVWNNNVVRDEFGIPSYAVLTGIDVTAERTSTDLMSHVLSASIATALVGVDTSGTITLFNAGASHLLGWSSAEVVGRPFVELFDARQLHERTGALGEGDSFLCLVGMIGDREESLARDWTWRTRSGRELIVSMTMSVTDDDVENRVGFLCVGRDVTEQREGQETLVEALEKERTAVERLRSLDRAKDEFVSTVSHELRTPVTSIIGFTEMLRDGSVVEPLPDQLPMLRTIARSGERLVAICNDLLLLSGFEAPVPAGLLEPVDLRACVRAVVEWAEPLMRRHDIALDVDAGEVALTARGDRGQLDRVLTNLVGNAVKFTAPGGAISVWLEESADSAVLAVRDTGIGIDPAEHEAVFQRFYRTETAQVQAIPGTGLGLSIVQAIVAAHGGRIDLDSDLGRGTTFRVVLPRDDDAADALGEDVGRVVP